MARKEELEEARVANTECDFPAFAINHINNFCYDSFTGSPMHNLGLGLVCTIISIVFQLASLLDVKKELSDSIKKSMEDLVRARIDFGPLEILASFKTTSWIGSEYMRFAKLICYTLRYLDICIAKKNHANVNMKEFNSKMCKTYL